MREIERDLEASILEAFTSTIDKMKTEGIKKKQRAGGAAKDRKKKDDGEEKKRGLSLAKKKEAEAAAANPEFTTATIRKARMKRVATRQDSLINYTSGSTFTMPVFKR